MLEQNGHEVLMARTEDVYVSLYDRVDMANENDVDLVISLHYMLTQLLTPVQWV